MRMAVVAHVVTPIVIGGFTYLAWRTDSLLMFRWCDHLGIHPLVAALREHACGARPYVPSWFLYSFPDAAWVYAATCAQRLIWRRHANRLESRVWCAIPAFLAVGGEVGQMTGLVPGTFCCCDLTLCVLAAMAALALTGEKRQTSDSRLA